MNNSTINAIVVLLIVFAFGILIGHGIWNKPIDSNRWRNCDTDPPNFSGICCRWFEDDQTNRASCRG